MFLQQLFNGLTMGATYALVAVGFSMVYGVLELVNFANGAFYVFAPYMIILFYVSWRINFWVSFVLIAIATGLLGAAMNSFILTPIRNTPKALRSSQMVATLGVSTMMTNGLMAMFGSETKRFPNMFDFEKVRIGDAILTWSQIVIMIASVIIMAILSFIVYKTRMGTAMRSISQNSTAARAMGVNVNRIITITFFIGTCAAAIAGTFVAMYYGSTDTVMYTSVSMKTFASAILGGIGSIPGAMVGGFTVGMLETFATGYISSAYKDVISFGILIIVLIFKPTGLLGQKNITKV